MELYLPPLIPQRKMVGKDKGKFVKGGKSPKKGMTFDEYYGKEKSEDIRRRLSEAHIGKTHPKSYFGKKVVAIKDGKLLGVFESATAAAQFVGISRKAFYRYFSGQRKPKNGIQWFYEKDPQWTNLITE